ncbi:IPT/TIG domain-containing protein, partial [Terriglobus sp. YAF25]
MRPGTRTLFILLALFIRALPGDSQTRTPVPRIFFSDLLSGPVAGGQNDQGAFVTIYGSGFGSSRGTSYVTIGDVAAVSYPVWSEDKISFQLGRNAKSGQILLHTGSGPVSNGIP